MPDTHSPKYFLSQSAEDDLQRATAEQAAAIRAHRERVWNELIPRCAVAATKETYGVRYLHPTKGWKTVGKRHFAIRGVI